jgi:hypothetical protein
MTAYLSVAAWRGRSHLLHAVIAMSDSIFLILATATTLGVLALAFTIFRVWHRFRKLHLWWDDYWAMISLFFSLINWMVVWFRDDDRREYVANIIPKAP